MEQLVLDGGVDLAHAAPATPAGKLRECYNYEAGWERGYSRIDGFERFDGNTSPASTTGWVITLPTANITGTFTPPENLTWTTDDESGDAGTLVVADVDPTDPANTLLYLFFREGRLRPSWGSTITGDESGASFVLNETLAAVSFFEDYFATHEEYLVALQASSEILRTQVRPVPGGGTIAGVHWHEDAVYAVRDVQSITVSEADAGKFVEGMYVFNAAGQVGRVVDIDADTYRLEIAPATAKGFVVEPSDTISICLQFRYDAGTDPEFKPDEIITTSLGDYSCGIVNTRASDWAGDNGVGECVLYNGPDGELPVDEVVTGAAGGSCAVDVPLFAHNAAAEGTATVVTAPPKSAVATLWQSTDDGWVSADTGNVVQFTEGTTDPFDSTPVDQTSEMQVGKARLIGNPTTPKWLPADQAGLTAALKASDLNIANGNVLGLAYVGGTLIGTDPISCSQWKLQGAGIPTASEITGIQVKARVFADLAGCRMTVQRKGNNKKVTRILDTTDPGTDPGVWPTFGGPNEDWGLDLTPELLNSGDFEFTVDFSFPFGVGSIAAVDLDQVRVQVNYGLLPGSLGYLWDGTADIGTVQISDAVVTDGSWDTDDAEGFFRLEDFSIIVIPEGTEIWTAPGGDGGSGLLIAKVASNVEPVTLPGTLLLDEERSRYQFISYNFFATESGNAIYGCSGAGPAFWYNPEDNQLKFITTGVDDDKPRHLAPHQHRLALGYIWGEVYVSAPGEPDNFNGADFAASFGFGDKITGLMPVAGDALAVFTESTVNMLTGAAGDQSNPPRQQIINANVGAIEYTVQSSGNRPIYASFRGIETLETTEQFGEFFTTPLTYDISPWLLERLQTAAGLEATDRSVVNSVVVNNKNQYRLFFADGYVMTLTYVGPEKTPQNTIQQYYFESEPAQYARCYATASGVTTTGRNRAFFTVEQRPSAPVDASRTGSPEIDYVYELDRGRTFDSGTIHAHMTLTYNFSGQQQQSPANKRYNIIQLHGKVPGYADLRLSRAGNYEDLDTPPLNYESVTLGSLTHWPEAEPKAKYAKGRLSGRGFAISLRINHVSDFTNEADERVVEFPHILQLITFIDDEPNRLNR